MNVLLIPEDFRQDRYILKPIFEALMDNLGRPSARVEVCVDPLLGGVRQALKSELLAEIVEQYQGKADVFVLCVDRDGEAGRRQRLDQIEHEFQTKCVFLSENAWEEIETWVLAGLDLPGEWRWQVVRKEVQVKEQYFEPLANQRGLADSLGGGRKVLGEEASRRIRAIRQKCPEDFDALARRIEAAVITR